MFALERTGAIPLLGCSFVRGMFRTGLAPLRMEGRNWWEADGRSHRAVWKDGCDVGIGTGGSRLVRSIKLGMLLQLVPQLVHFLPFIELVSEVIDDHLAPQDISAFGYERSVPHR